MLQLIDIRKSYKTADFTQTALDGVSVAFRDNEFAAVLGPSGSGKTTMLNIIGGLDHCDSGDLQIDGISTKKYRDPDWDTYRNNRIGFVFQSYNLIPHQTVLANVELALTLSGVSAAKRRERAKQALEEVGLGEHMHKRPTQLSGGQMQRVAIARALINDPEMLLADEPTGALDTQTGYQVMQLLTKIAENRLVIMVTHNSALAERYATRIIHLSDGQISSDSHPFDPSKENKRAAKEPRRAHMSLFTAVSLSFSNLMTKKGRTFITSLAGSIGIIGIAAILALANGLNLYIQTIEQETMSIYPLAIQNAGFDLTNLFAGEGGGENDGGRDRERGAPPRGENEVRVHSVVETMFSYQTQNDLAALQSYLDQNGNLFGPLVSTIQYTYNITPQIYLADTAKGAVQVNPDPIMSGYGMSSGANIDSLTTSFGMGGMKAFHEMPGDIDMFAHQYNVVAGNWPQNYDETVLVLTSSGGISDYLLYGMGIYDRAELEAFVEMFMNGIQTDIQIGEEEPGGLSYEQLMDTRFKVVVPADCYQYDSTYKIWVDKSADSAYMRSLVEKAMTLKIVGIVQPLPDASATSLSAGVNYTPGLLQHLMAQAATKQVVQDQIAKPGINVLSGRSFSEENEERRNSVFSFYDLITINEEMVRGAFDVDVSAVQLDFSALGNLSLDFEGMDFAGIDMSSLTLPPLDLTTMELSGADLSALELPPPDIAALAEVLSNQVNISPEDVTAIVTQVLEGFLQKSVEEGVDFADPDTDLAQLLSDYLADPAVQQQISGQLAALVDPTALGPEVTEALQTYVQGALDGYLAQLSGVLQSSLQAAMQTYMAQAMETLMPQLQGILQTQITSTLMPQMQSQLEGAMQAVLAPLAGQLQEAITIDQEAFSQAFQVDMGEEELLDLMSTLMSSEESTQARILTSLGYANPNVPSTINIYPLDFESKLEIEDILQGYNDRAQAGGQPEQVIRYTDIVGVMMSSVTDIVNMISYTLIAFVAISLVVSSIMIGVITYISVLERKKEIGILRAIGASKRDIRRVFNAETLIVGFVAGALGIVATILLIIPANIIVESRVGISQIAQLPAGAALVLIGVSMVLAFVAGLFPSSAAARKDPVEALRSE